MLTDLQWVDQDEQNEAADDDYMNQFGGGMGEDGGFGGIDFSKLGGGGDMPGMEGLGAGAEDEEEDEVADKGKVKAKATPSKIEEVE